MKLCTISLKFEGRNSEVLLGVYVKSGLIADLTDEVCYRLENIGIAASYEQIKVQIIEDEIKSQNAVISISCEGADSDIFEDAIEQILDNLNELIQSEIRALESRGEGKFTFKLLESDFYLIPDAMPTR